MLAVGSRVMRRWILLALLVLHPCSSARAEPQQGQPCDAAGKCAAGLVCVRYYGIAGPRGPQMTSCEIRCSTNEQCPRGQSCVTIADGPGQVCRRR
jgi:hypothetical protein